MLVGLFSRPFNIGLFSSIQQEFPSIKRNCLFSRRLYLMIPSPICVNTFSDPKQKNFDPQKSSWRRTLSWNITRQDKETKSMQMGSCTSDVYKFKILGYIWRRFVWFAFRSKFASNRGAPISQISYSSYQLCAILAVPQCTSAIVQDIVEGGPWLSQPLG